MPDKISCKIHGEANQAFLCEHLTGESHGLGFNRNDVSAGNPFPDAWCDNCEIIRAAHGDWSDAAQALVNIAIVCSGCYERARIRHTRPSVTFNDLANLHWKCGTCEEWHEGPCLDFGISEPHYWSKITSRELDGMYCHLVFSTHHAKRFWMKIIAPSMTTTSSSAALFNYLS